MKASKTALRKFPLRRFIAPLALTLLAASASGQVRRAPVRRPGPRIPSIRLIDQLTAQKPKPIRQIMVKFRNANVNAEQFAEDFSRRYPLKMIEELAGLNRKSFRDRIDASSVMEPVTFLRSIPEIGWHVMAIPSQGYLGSILTLLKAMPNVADAIPDGTSRVLSPPTNPQWGSIADEYIWAQLLTNIGLDFTPTRDYDSGGWNYSWHLETIDAQLAWENYPASYPTSAQRKLMSASQKPLVAVLDTGLDFNHPAFKAAGGTSTDASQGGQIEYSLARDFYEGANSSSIADVMDVFGHGTTVSGLIASAPNNGQLVPGIGFPARLVPVRIYGEDGDGSDSDLIRGIVYATDAGCVIVNISARTDLDYSRAGQDAVNYAWSHNTLVVAALGNDGNTPQTPGDTLIRRYPASYIHVLPVGGSTMSTNSTAVLPFDYSGSVNDESIAFYSNRGQNAGVVAPAGDETLFYDDAPNAYDDLWIAINEGLGYVDGTIPEYVFPFSAAPTYLVPLSDPDESNPIGGYAQQGNYGLNYGAIPGTSVACPIVSGIAALFAAKNGITQATAGGPQRILEAIQRGAENIQGRADGGFSTVFGWGRVNAYRTLLEQNTRNATVGGVTGLVLSGDTVVANNAVYLDSTAPGSLNATTTADGVFHLFNISPGAHTLITSINGQQISQAVTIKAGCDYNGATLVKTAATCVVSPQNVLVPYGTTKQFSAVVTGLSSSQIAWSVVLGTGGSLNSSGLLTAPTNPGGSNQEIVKATALADTSVNGTSLVTYVPRITAFSVSPTSVAGGNRGTGTITLSHPVVEPCTITLTKNNAGVNIPTSVSVPVGATQATFTFSVPTTTAAGSCIITAQYAGVSRTATVQTQVGQASNVSGTLTPQMATNKAQSVTFVFHPTNNTGDVTVTQTLNADGTYTIVDLPRKNFVVKVKAKKWLSTSIPANAASGNVTGVNGTMLAGDVVSDNTVDLNDLIQLLNLYGTNSSDVDWDDSADFDTNGTVDLIDLIGLLNNYGATGS